MRKLVTLRQINAITSIPGADFIERVAIDGWSAVATKGDFSVGDPCLYFEIDCYIPYGDTRFEFLMKDKIVWSGVEGVRIRTREFRKQISQGLALPLAQFPEVVEIVESMTPAQARAIDFTKLLGVLKWEREIPAELLALVNGGMPSYIRKTDVERIQNIPEIFDEQADVIFQETVKLDGYSMTVFSHLQDSGVCMRNWWLKNDVPNEYAAVANDFGLLEAVRKYPKSIALQGELIGPRVCGNHDRLSAREFRLFKIYDIAQSRYVGYQEREEIIADLRLLGANILQVPTVRFVRLGDLGSVESVLESASGPSLNPQVSCEGKVFCSMDGRTSFKAISNSYLLTNTDS
jgi:RNA ligase (TIGR02306 family)